MKTGNGIAWAKPIEIGRACLAKAKPFEDWGWPSGQGQSPVEDCAPHRRGPSDFLSIGKLYWVH